ARVMGIDTDRVYAWTFGLNAAICGASGALVAMTWIVHPYLGLPYTVRSFMIVILAGLGNVVGVLVAALGLGVAENFAGFILRGAAARLPPGLLLRAVPRNGRGRSGRRGRGRADRLGPAGPAGTLFRHRHAWHRHRRRRAGRRMGLRRRRRRHGPAAVSRRGRRTRDVLLLPLLRHRGDHLPG